MSDDDTLAALLGQLFGEMASHVTGARSSPPRNRATVQPPVYRTSALNGHRYRRTQAELAEIDTAIYEIAEAEEPVTVRGLFYRVMSRGVVPKTEHGMPWCSAKPSRCAGAVNCPTGGSLTAAGYG